MAIKQIKNPADLEGLSKDDPVEITHVARISPSKKRTIYHVGIFLETTEKGFATMGLGVDSDNPSIERIEYEIQGGEITQSKEPTYSFKEDSEEYKKHVGLLGKHLFARAASYF